MDVLHSMLCRIGNSHNRPTQPIAQHYIIRLNAMRHEVNHGITAARQSKADEAAVLFTSGAHIIAQPTKRVIWLIVTKEESAMRRKENHQKYKFATFDRRPSN